MATNLMATKTSAATNNNTNAIVLGLSRRWVEVDFFILFVCTVKVVGLLIQTNIEYCVNKILTFGVYIYVPCVCVYIIYFLVELSKYSFPHFMPNCDYETISNLRL
jgi:hypothetical protein